MAIVVTLDEMLVRRKVKSRDLAAHVGITEAKVSLLKSGKVRTKEMISHVFSLDEAAQAFQAQINELSAIKVMIKP